MRPPAPLVALALLAACGPAPARPNVILVSIDTLRPDHMGCYGYGRPTTPNIDRFADEGVVFETHVSSSSWTLPAHAALFTSVSDTVHGCVESRETALSPAFTTLAERMADGGYRTGGFYGGPYLHRVFGLGQGFETYRYCVEDDGTFAAERVRDWELDPVAHGRSHRGVTNPQVYAAGRAWLEEHADEPFFLFLHFWDVHYDFTPPPPWDTKFNPGYEGPIDGRGFFFDDSIRADMPEEDRAQLLALYDGEIGWTDTFLGRLRADLEALDLADETIVVITSDHGTEFFEHGGKGHRTTLYDELIRIPLILWYPERFAPRRVQAQSRMVDVGPTLLELVDLPAPEGVMGHSLVGLAEGGAVDFDNLAISELYSAGHALRSVRDRDAKFLLDEADPGNPAVRWFDLRADPPEMEPRADLAGPLWERAEGNYLRAKGLLETFIARRPGAPVEPTIPAGVETLLKASGYGGGDEEDG